MTERRTSVIAAAAGGAVVIGGVTQAYAEGWGLEPLTVVTNTQFAWTLLCFVVAWALAQGRLTSGLVAGGLTGLGLITSYYGLQWVADGWDAAASQFTHSSGAAWVVASVGCGAVIGSLGALAGSSATDHPTRKALGLATMGLVLALGPLLWSILDEGTLREDWRWFAAAVYAAVGLFLGALALRRCGVTAFLRGLGLATVGAAAAFGCLLALQSTVLYATS